jgi:hypothetical protein
MWDSGLHGKVVRDCLRDAYSADSIFIGISNKVDVEGRDVKAVALMRKSRSKETYKKKKKKKKKNTLICEMSNGI